jgi:hypothetical protein
VGKHGSIAVVQGFIRTLKEQLRQVSVVPLRREDFQSEVNLIADWYNEYRPHKNLTSAQDGSFLPMPSVVRCDQQHRRASDIPG